MPQIGMGVGPSNVVLGVDEHTGSFSVYNAGETEETFTATAYDFTLDVDGKQVPATQAILQGAATWMSIKPAAFTLLPKETQVVEFHVALPEVVPPGDHYAGIKILGTMSDAAWLELKPHLGGQVVVRTQLAFPVTVVARVPGKVIPWVEAPPLAEAPGPLIASLSGDYAFTPQIVNEGNVAAVWRPGTDPSVSPEQVVPTLRRGS